MLFLTFCCKSHDDVNRWKSFRVTGPLCGKSPHNGQWRGALMLSLNRAWTNGWVNNRYAGDLRRNRAHYHVTVMHRQLDFCSIYCLGEQQRKQYIVLLLIFCEGNPPLAQWPVRCKLFHRLTSSCILHWHRRYLYINASCCDIIC